MKTIVVLAGHPESAEAIRSALNSEEYRVIHRTSLEDSEPLLVHGLASLCILDMDLNGAQGMWLIEKIRRRAPRCPLVILTGVRQGEWEEEAYLKGAAQVIAKPVRPRLLQTLMGRLFARDDAYLSQSPGTELVPLIPVRHESNPPTSPLTPTVVQNFEVLRKFSAILTHSLHAEGMVRQFLLLLREMLSVNRAVVFLRQPVLSLGGFHGTEESRRLRSICSLGLAAGILEHFELSLDSGTGGQLFRLGRILRSTSEEIARDPEALKEFDMLGVQVAVPILDRERLVGAAFFGGRITGEPLVNAELELIFHLFEQLGLAIRNIWLHDQLAGNHELMAGMLRELSSACIVVGRDLTVLHANKAARRFFGGGGNRGGEMEFCDLPHPLGNKVYQVLKTGAAVPAFRYEPVAPAKAVFDVSIVPFHRGDFGPPLSVLLTAEDRTQAEQLQRLEIEANNLRLVKAMGERLAHEIGNALVPISTHQQLLANKYADADFRESLSTALANGVKRISRLVNQMRYLSRDVVVSPELVPLATLVEEAFREAQKYQPVQASQLRFEDSGTPVILTGDRAALKHAFTEVMINALQANPAAPKVGVHLCDASNGNGVPAWQIEVQDDGGGFNTEEASKASTPFFTTRNVGLGLGLAVTRKIIETHHGKLEIIPASAAKSGLVRISLPQAMSSDREG